MREKADVRGQRERTACASRSVRLHDARWRFFGTDTGSNNKATLNITCSKDLRERASCCDATGAERRRARATAAIDSIAPIAQQALADSSATHCEDRDATRLVRSPAATRAEGLRGVARPISITENLATFTWTPASDSSGGLSTAASADAITLNAGAVASADRPSLRAVSRARFGDAGSALVFSSVEDIPNRPGRVVINFPSRLTEPGTATAS